MNIVKITLLTSAEQSKYHKFIPEIEETWWLKSPGCDHTAQTAHNGITTAIRPYNKRYVRPVLHLKDVTAEPGDKLKIFDYQWTVLDSSIDIVVICDTVVTYRAFDKEDHDWIHSDLRKWLNQWLKKRQKTTNELTHKRYRCMNNFGMMYEETPFLKEWLFPMLIAIISSAIIIPLSLSTQLELPPLVLNLALALGVLLCVMEGFFLFAVLCGSHKDTAIRWILLIVSTLILMNLAQWLPDFTCLLANAAIIITNAICAKYLRSIKYYS